MKKIKRSILFLIYISSVSISFAQSPVDEFEAFKRKTAREYEAFKDKVNQEYEQFRRQANEEYANFMAQPWKKIELKPAEKTPERPSPKPLIINRDNVPTPRPKPEDKPSPRPIAEDTTIAQPSKPIVIDKVIDVPTQPQPKPVEPIRDNIPQETPLKVKTLKVPFYGAECELRSSDFKDFRLKGNSTKDFANGWKYLNSDITNNLVIDCLKARENLHLCDWAYLQLISEVADRLCKSDNDKTLLMGFIFCQSGYKMRFGRSQDGRLHLFYAPTGLVYNTPHLYIDGQDFYLYGKRYDTLEAYEVCNFSFPKEQNMSFAINIIPNLGYSPSSVRTVRAEKYKDISASVSVNKHLIDFYNTYPDATLTSDPNSKWLIHANTPASPELKKDLYPALKKAIEGKNGKEAVEILLNFAQSFPYGYDEQIWGWDRAFFPDESWCYPKSDCEDHAINFTRLVRDLTGLDTALVVYPNHVAAAVAFAEEVAGDYVIYKGKRYTICDPTVFYANVGRSMTGVNNASAVLVELN